MLSHLFFGLLGVASVVSGNARDAGNDDIRLARRTSTAVSGVTNMCPDLNFQWHAKNTNTMPYYMDLLSVDWVGDNTYELTINVKGEQQIDMKYLYSLKIIGINGPQGTKQLWGKNENTYIIDSPTDFTTKIQVYGQSIMVMNVKLLCHHCKFNTNIYRVMLLSTKKVGNGVQLPLI